MKLVAKTEVVELADLAAKFDRMAADHMLNERARVEAGVISGCINFTIDTMNARAVSVDVHPEQTLQ